MACFNRLATASVVTKEALLDRLICPRAVSNDDTVNSRTPRPYERSMSEIDFDPHPEHRRPELCNLFALNNGICSYECGASVSRLNVVRRFQEPRGDIIETT